jgi:hypothetical protein
MFSLPPLYVPAPQLHALGAPNGPLDGGDDPDRTATVPVGHVFFGQFVDHDITLDVTSSLSAVADPLETPNARTPTLDLDCVYGLGFEASPFLYHAAGKFANVKLLTGKDGTAVNQPDKLADEDLCRTSHGTAVIGDPRNDENRIVSQLQLAMIRFHNHVVDALHAGSEPLEGRELYERAREVTTWHYQWVVIHDFLVHMCGAPLVQDILGSGRRHYCADFGDPFIPVEFSAAAYRFGHSMIPQRVRVQTGDPERKLFGKVFGPGFTPLSDKNAIVEWPQLVTAPAGGDVQMAEKLNTKLATALLDLPFIPESDVRSLATRNLLRGQTFLLPSGESIAAAMGREPSEIDMVHNAAVNLAGDAANLAAGTPLWLYLLVEAERIGRETEPGLFNEGEGLGPVGARIVAETIIGLIELDSRSFLAKNRNWRPEEGVGVAALGEMLTYSGA